MRRLARRALATPELGLIWTLEALNYAVHVVLRPEPWNIFSVAVGYNLWAMQLVCFARLQLGDAGSVPDGWDALAAAGKEEAYVCTRSGRLVPPRARYSKRAGAVVLGLDHYCHWLATPIGFSNRKLFILFITYSAVFCWLGAMHSWHELCWGAPSRLRLPALPDTVAAAIRSSLSSSGDSVLGALRNGLVTIMTALPTAAWAWASELCSAAAGHHHPLYIYALLVSAIADPVSACLLSAMSVHQLILVLFNRTTLEPTNARYDIGLLANWRQVFGARPALWALPLTGPGCGGPDGCDGIHWPESERWVQLQERANQIRNAHARAGEAHQAFAQRRAEARARSGQVAWRRGADDSVSPLIVPKNQYAPPPPPWWTIAQGGGGRGGGSASSGGRWALARHYTRTPASLTLRTVYSAFDRLKAVLRAWERRFCCGLFAMSSLRLGHRLLVLLRARAASRSSAKSAVATPASVLTRPVAKPKVE